jgi:hypothetical protein
MRLTRRYYERERNSVCRRRALLRQGYEGQARAPFFGRPLRRCDPSTALGMTAEREAGIQRGEPERRLEGGKLDEG